MRELDCRVLCSGNFINVSRIYFHEALSAVIFYDFSRFSNSILKPLQARGLCLSDVQQIGFSGLI